MRKPSAFIASSLLAALLLAASLAYSYFGFHNAISNLNAIPLSPENYQPAATELIRLSQSDPTFYTQDSLEYLNPFDPVWAPPSLQKLHPEQLYISPEKCIVTWGGGFYHCGWELLRGPATADGAGYTWTLSFFSEDDPKKVLQTINVRSDQRLTEDEYISQILAEFDRRLASQSDDDVLWDANWYLAASRCVFLEKHHRLDLLPAQVRKAAANYPHDWRDFLLGYLLDHDKPNAAQSLQHWADKTPGPTPWIYAAYAFYQSGNQSAGDTAIKKALATTTSAPDWLDYDALYELGMAVRLYQTQHFTECVTLCNAILFSPHRLFTTAPAVKHLRDLASSPATSRPPQPPSFDKYTSMDPFGGFDLTHFLATATSAPTAHQ